MNAVSCEEVKMNQTAGAIATPERPSKPGTSVPGYRAPDAGLQYGEPPASGLDAAWAKITESATDRANHETTIITVDLAEGESAREFSTRLRLLLMFMNRETGSVSATVSPSFRDDTYPAMLALVNGFHRSGAAEDWSPDGPRAMRLGKARHLFVSVDMPVADRSPSPDTLLEVVAAHKIEADWYDQRVRPRISTIGVDRGLTIVMYGVPKSHTGHVYPGSVFERERARNLSGKPGPGGVTGIHFSRQPDWTATAVV